MGALGLIQSNYPSSGFSEGAVFFRGRNYIINKLKIISFRPQKGCFCEPTPPLQATVCQSATACPLPPGWPAWSSASWCPPWRRDGPTGTPAARWTGSSSSGRYCQSCPPPVMSTTSHVHRQSCPLPVMSTTSHVHRQ